MRKKVKIYPTALAVSGLILGMPATVSAQERLTQESETDAEIAYLRNQLSELQAREAEARQRAEALETRLSRLEQFGSNPISNGEAEDMRGRFAIEQSFAQPSDRSFIGVNRAIGIQANQEADQSAVGGGDRKAPAPTLAQEDVTRQQQGAFGRRLGAELGMSYTHFDNARINLDGFLALDAIFLGTISIDRINADIFTLEPSIDLGLSDRLFVDASIPLLSRISNFQSGGAGGSAAGLAETTIRGAGIGDASIGLSYRLLPESLSTPDVVLNTRVKFPTGRHPFGIGFTEVVGTEGNLSVPDRLSFGTGVYGASVGVSILKTLDPMVVFGSATYFHNFSRNFDDIDEIVGDQPGRVKIGNAYQIGAGLAFALNDKSSISMSYTQRIVERTSLTPENRDQRTVVGSQANVALMNIGATFSLEKNLTLVANVGLGLTDDSPDMAISVRIPFRF